MSQRRPYRLGKRQASVDETKRRILEAAAAEYEGNGIEETTMLAVARRADVASGTVLYHYPEPEMLADAVVDMWIEGADLPEVPEVEAGLSLEARVELLIGTVFQMYDGDETAARIFLRNPRHPAMRRAEAFWNGRLAEVIGATLGSHLTEADKPVIATILGGHFVAGLHRRGIPEDQLGETVARLIVAWLETGE